MVLNEMFCILTSSFLSPMRMHSVLQQLRVKTFIQTSIKRSVEEHFEGE